MLDWIRGWRATLRIMIFEREIYRILTHDHSECTADADLEDCPRWDV
jgi:hypothetical protein